MTEYVHLVGAEEVSRAAGRMQAAADDMNRAAMSIESSLDTFSRRMEEWIQRLEVLAQENSDV